MTDASINNSVFVDVKDIKDKDFWKEVYHVLSSLWIRH